MPSRNIITERDSDMLRRWLDGMDRPFTVSVTKGRRRSLAQNRLQRTWCNEISEQLGDMTPEDVRSICKLTHGVPILRAENEAFCESYDEIVKPLPYEQKLKLMAEPLDFPVTRLMTVAQTVKYLDAIYHHYSEQGLVLTEPESAHS